MKEKNNNITKLSAFDRKGQQQGGKREGAGRPKGSGKYGEPTTAIRVPSSWAVPIKTLLKRKHERKSSVAVSDVLNIWEPNASKSTSLPLFTNKIAAGFPSPADDHIETSLDLNEYLVEHPAATFYLRVTGDSMLGAGIQPNDILIVDRSLDATDGKIVIASLNGELTVKRLHKKGTKISLMPENDYYQPIEVEEDTDFQIWGVVTNVIHRF